MSRIVQLANFYGPESGGLRTVVHRLAAGYRRAGHDTVLVVPGTADADELTPDGRRITIASPPLPGAGGYRVIVGRSRVSAVLRGLQPDRIEVSDKLSLTWVGGWAARHGVPALLFSHERLDGILAGRVPGWFPLRPATDWWNRRVTDRFPTVVCASAFAAEEFGRIGVPVRRIPLGVDLDRFAPLGSRPGRGLELVTVGRLSAEKRPDLAIDTVAELRAAGVDARLTMVGAGPLRAALEARAGRLPVTFTGHVHDRDLLAGLLAAADIGLAPCPIEAFGLGVLETMACGTPVVAADRGAAPELVAGGGGRAAPPSPPALAAAVQALAALPVPARRSAARARADRFPWTATVDALLAAHQLPAWIPA